jgi:hypothetical protein
MKGIGLHPVQGTGPYKGRLQNGISLQAKVQKGVIT